MKYNPQDYDSNVLRLNRRFVIWQVMWPGARPYYFMKDQMACGTLRDLIYGVEGLPYST